MGSNRIQVSVSERTSRLKSWSDKAGTRSGTIATIDAAALDGTLAECEAAIASFREW
jgi:hypothetical protein